MSFRFMGLSIAPFIPLFSLSDTELEARGMRRVIADDKPGFPCRVTLADAEPGERVLLLPYEHQTVHTPYRASGPIFVRESADATYDETGDIPSSLRIRPLSVRAYDAGGMMLDADVISGVELDVLLARFFATPAISYIHAHYARRGCYAARIERAN